VSTSVSASASRIAILLGRGETYHKRHERHVKPLM